MLDIILSQKKKDIKLASAVLSEALFDGEAEPDSDETIKRVISIVENCQDALDYCYSVRDYNEIIEIAGVWRFFLDSKGIRYNFNKRRNADIFSGEPTDRSKRLASLLGEKTLLNPNGRIISGIATRDSFDKSVPVEVVRRFKHAYTGKYVKTRKKYIVHDEFNTVSKGDLVFAVETRPISKKKRYCVLSVKNK